MNTRTTKATAARFVAPGAAMHARSASGTFTIDQLAREKAELEAERKRLAVENEILKRELEIQGRQP